MNSNKHAFLIMAYSHWDCLEALMRQLDDARNDIYIHININTEDFDENRFKNICINAGVFFQKRYVTNWGQSNTVFRVWKEFLEEAEKKGIYSYCHYLTGQDLLLVSNDNFHAFFDSLPERNFLVCYKPNWYRRCRYSKRQIFVGGMHSRGLKKRCVNFARVVFFTLQSAVGYDKVRKYFPNKLVMTGDGHFSLSMPFVHYLNERWDQYEKLYQGSFAPDESLLQTLIFNSPFRSSLYVKNGNYSGLRYMVWIKDNGGSPKDLRVDDLNKAFDSGCLIARRFNEKTGKDAIDFVLQRTKNKK